MSLSAKFVLDLKDFQLDVDFDIPSQGITALYGPSGAGKSTILRCLCGLERPKQASLKFKERTWHDSSKNIFVPTHQRRIGYVIQEPGLFPHLDVKGNLEYACKRAPEAQFQFDEVVDLLGVSELLNRRTHSLSGGERQRVVIARSLLTSPELLLFDEPLSALDVRSKAQIMPYIEKLNHELKIPAIYISHMPDEVIRLADHVIMIERGKIISAGPIQDMLAQLDEPLWQGKDVATIINANIVEHDAEFDLWKLKFSGGSLYMPAHDAALDQEIRVRIQADDVSLTLEKPAESSILNIIPAQVIELAQDEDALAQMLVKLRAGDDFLLARITRKSAEGLGIEPGKQLFAQVKGVALVR